MERARTRQARRIEAKPTISALDVIAVRLLAPVAARLVRALELDRLIREAGMEVIPVVYMSRILFNAIIATSVVVILASLLFIVPNPIPWRIRLVLLILPPAVTPFLAIAAGIAKPQSLKAMRRRLTEEELPFLAAYMATMAYGGLGPDKVLEKIANAKIFQGISREAARILRDIRIFGMDPLTAIEKNVLDHPSRLYRDFMLGYITTVRTGGDVIHYLEIRTQELFRQKIEETRMIAEKISLIVEVFVAVAVIATIALYTLFIVGSVIRIAGTQSMIPMLIMYSFIGLPLFIVMLIAMVHKTLPRTSVGAEKQLYSALPISTPLAIVAAAAILLAFNVPQKLLTGLVDTGVVAGIELALAACFATASMGPIASYLAYARREKGIERQLAEFLRDLSEIRKTGLSPEKSLLLISQRNYGKLTPVVRRIAGAIALGVSIAQAVRRAVRGYTNWTMLAIFKILVDSIELGGGSAEIIDALARYTNALSDLAEELRRRLRPYFYMPYAGAIILVASTLTLLLLLVQASKTLALQTAQQGTPATAMGITVAATPRDLAMLAVATLAGLTLDGYLMGLLAGKIKDQLLAPGFIHALILTALVAAIGIPLTNTILSIAG